MRRLLASHDIAGVYRLLQRDGVSQPAIAARTGMNQNESRRSSRDGARCTRTSCSSVSRRAWAYPVAGGARLR